MADLSPAGVRDEASRRIRAAADHVQRAQRELELAAQALCSVTGAAPLWVTVGKLQDRARATWGRLSRFHERGRFGLDGAALEKLARKEPVRADP